MTFQPGDFVTLTAAGPTAYPTDHPYRRYDPRNRTFVFLGPLPEGDGRRVAVCVGNGRDAPGWVLNGRDHATLPALRDEHPRGWWVGTHLIAPATDDQIRDVLPELRRVHDLLQGAPRSDPKAITDIDEYREFVAQRVREEARRRGWCSEVETWLTTLGLETPRPKVRYSVTLTAEEEVPDGVSAERFVERQRRVASLWLDTQSLTFGRFPTLSARANTVTVEQIDP